MKNNYYLTICALVATFANGGPMEIAMDTANSVTKQVVEVTKQVHSFASALITPEPKPVEIELSIVTGPMTDEKLRPIQGEFKEGERLVEICDGYIQVQELTERLLQPEAESTLRDELSLTEDYIQAA